MDDDDYRDTVLRIIPRAKWGALPPKFTEELPLPAERMLIIPTNTEKCMSKAECYQAMRTLQKYHMEEKGMPDLPYSFLIGGDKRIYEGRGWGVMIRRRDMQDWVDERVVFGLIGHQKDDDKLIEQMCLIAYDLMYYAISKKYLVNFDEYGQQDEDAKIHERKEFEKDMFKKAEKECKEDIERERRKAEKKERDRKKWEENINKLHFDDAKKPKFKGDQKELKEAMRENKMAFDTFKKMSKKHLETDSESDLNTEDILNSDEEETEDAPL